MKRMTAITVAAVLLAGANLSKYRVNAVKQGQPIVLDFHPQLGTVHEVTRETPAVRPWTMPLEPPNTTRFRNELPPR